jgi:CheY-like chemotaxis protein
VLSLNDVVSGMQKMLKRVLGEDIDLAVSLAPDLAAVRADPGQVEQVLMNLVVNARDAMPGGGQLTIETANVALDEGYAGVHEPVLPGAYVLLAVSDTGAGMDEATKARVFEPFFTTKEMGKGTGLGLATVYGIVKQSNGFIWVYSEPGQGTSFKVYLPRVSDPIEASRAGTAPSEMRRGTETIMLVEDDTGVRRVVCGVLERLGYQVLQAERPIAALELAETVSPPPDLLLTDVIMPEMNGRELARRFEAKWPKLKVLYLSGYTDEAIVRHGVLEPGVSFLQKPFTPEALERKVRQVLDRQA